MALHSLGAGLMPTLSRASAADRRHVDDVGIGHGIYRPYLPSCARFSSQMYVRTTCQLLGIGTADMVSIRSWCMSNAMFILANRGALSDFWSSWMDVSSSMQLVLALAMMVNSPLVARLPASLIWPLVPLMANRVLETTSILLGFITPPVWPCENVG